MRKKEDNILYLNPFEFDKHFFKNDWRPPNYGFFNTFHIARVEEYKNYLALPLPPHRRSVHYFMYLKSGSVIRNIGLSRYELRPNQIFFLPANQINTIEFVSKDASGFYCHFQPDIFLHPFLKIDLDHDFPFFQLKNKSITEVIESERIEQLCCNLETEYHLSQDKRFDLIPAYLLALFLEIKLTYASSKKTINASEAITQRYKVALSQYIYEKKSISEYAEYLSITPNHLNKCVKEAIGQSAHDLLNEMRILEAKVLLRQTTLSIGEIAYKIGQYETSDFCRLFKKSTNFTPNQYRKV